ncbi:MAG: MurR/RpiR family transcriptional regulator [Acetivibrionales bacterium]
MIRSQDMIRHMQEKMPGMSKGHKMIANYIINHYDKAAFMTAAKLGRTVGVSESTVVRFAVEMGFKGYPRLQKVLQELIKSKLTAAQRLEVTSSRIDENNILKSVLQADMEKIKITMEEINQEDFMQIVECVLNARKIYILGVRSSATLAGFLGFYFNLIFDNVRLVHTTSVSEMFEQILRASAGDVVIGISFPRYSKRTVKALKFAKSQGATVIAITDSKESPLTSDADHCIIARSDMASFVDSLVAPLSVINALIVAIGMRKKESIYNTFEKLETIWDEYQVYEKYDNAEPHGKVDY